MLRFVRKVFFFCQMLEMGHILPKNVLTSKNVLPAVLSFSGFEAFLPEFDKKKSYLGTKIKCQKKMNWPEITFEHKPI